MRSIFFLTCIFSGFCDCVIAQLPERTSFVNHGTSNGLPSNWVRTMTQDADGFVWAGTQNGLARNDGKTWTVFFNDPSDSLSLSNNDVFSLARDTEGRLWAATIKGINLYDPISGHFENSRNSRKKVFANPNLHLSQILPDKNGIIWGVANNKKLVRIDYDSDDIEMFEPPNESGEARYFGSIALSESTIWIGGAQGLWAFDRKASEFSHVKNSCLDQVHVHALHYSREKLYIGSNDLYVLDVENDSCAMPLYREGHGHRTHHILSIDSDSQGRIYIASDGGGLHFYDPTFETIVSYSDLAISNPSSISGWCAFVDDVDNIWYGQYHDGIDYSSRQSSVINYLKIRSKKEGQIEGSVHGAGSDGQGGIWICVDGGGLFHTTDINVPFVQINKSEGEGFLKVLNTTLVNDSTAWIATYGDGLFHYDLKRKVITRLDQMVDLKLDKDSEILQFPRRAFQIDSMLFVGTIGHNLVIVNLNSGVVQGIEDNTSSTFRLWVESIDLDHRGNVWLGTPGGLRVFDTETNKMRYWALVSGADKGDGKSKVNSVFTHNDVVWVGTNGGLVKFYPRSEKYIRYDRSHGLVENDVVSIGIDREGVLWLGTSGGVVRFDPVEERFDLLTGQGNHLATNFEKGRAHTTKEGLVLIPANKELIIVHPDNWNFERVSPKVYFTKIQLGDSTLSNKSGILRTSGSYILDYEKREVAFDFKSVIHDIPEFTKYTYRLVGFEQEFRTITDKTHAEYLNLDPGKYEFQVRAISGALVWSEDIASFKFEIPVPFWQTEWFRLVATILICAVLYVLYRMRLRAVERKNEALERKIESRTAELREQAIALDETNKTVMKVNEELADRNYLIEQQKGQIEESILVGSFVQKSALPGVSSFNEAFAKAMIVNKPKDIISGDFYFVEKKGDVVYFALGDCTGHGVAGALLTMIAINSLGEGVRNTRNPQPEVLLNDMHKHVLKTTRHRQDQGSHIGMDMVICAFNMKEKTLTYASGKSKFYKQIESGEVEICSGDRRSVGVKTRHTTKFGQQTISFQSGDRFFFLTDGLRDQLHVASDDARERFGTRRIRAMLTATANIPLEELEQNLLTTFDEWKGELGQTDDVLFIGFQIW